MQICLFYMMEFLFPLHCCFVYLVLVVVVNAQANEKHINQRWALEERSDQNQKKPAQKGGTHKKGGVLNRVPQPFLSLLLSKYKIAFQ